MQSQINLQGMCYDEKSSFLKGPAKAPPLITKYLYSDSGNSFSENGTDISKISIVHKGNFEVDEYFDIEIITQRNINSECKLITLGGDHSITFPIIKALSKIHDGMDILHIDAHADLYEELDGDRYSHACPFSRIMEGNYAAHLVQLGIRTMNNEQWQVAKKYGVEVVEMRNFENYRLPKFERPVYISLDMDGFDPAYAPGVSHHEPGGLSSRQVIDLLLNLDANVVGADIVEFNPDRDIQGLTGALAAKMLKEIIAVMAR